MSSFSPSSLCGVPFRVTTAAEFPSKRNGFEVSLEVDRRSSLVSSRKDHAWKFRRSEDGKASETLLCLADVETETEVEAGGEVVVVSEFEVEGKGEGVDVDVVMVRVRIAADVDTLEDCGGTAKACWKKVEDGIVLRDGGGGGREGGRIELDCRCREGGI